MAATVLAVDDSVTMRKVLEITFASPDFRCVTANGADAALQKVRTDKPDVVLADVTLDGKNGYELCKAIKQLSPETPVLILSSKHNPYDADQGSSAQADDFMDKPFDTQQLIDKVKKLVGARGEVKAEVKVAKAAPLPTAPVAQRSRTLAYSTVAGTPGVPALPAQQAVRPAVATAASAATTPATGIPAQQRPTAREAPQAAREAPAAARGAQTTRVSTPTPSSSPSPIAAAFAAPADGPMVAKLAGLGLTPAQVDAVLALSREVVERVVWEVVPVLAETLIKEEIARLTK